jgi:hypothetical protein
MKRNRFLPIVLTSNWTSEHTVDSDGSKEENSKADNGKTWINGKNVKNSVNCGLTYDRIKAIEGSPLFLKGVAGAWSEDY